MWCLVPFLSLSHIMRIFQPISLDHHQIHHAHSFHSISAFIHLCVLWCIRVLEIRIIHAQPPFSTGIHYFPSTFIFTWNDMYTRYNVPHPTPTNPLRSLITYNLYPLHNLMRISSISFRNLSLFLFRPLGEPNATTTHMLTLLNYGVPCNIHSLALLFSCTSAQTPFSPYH